MIYNGFFRRSFNGTGTGIGIKLKFCPSKGMNTPTGSFEVLTLGNEVGGGVDF